MRNCCLLSFVFIFFPSLIFGVKSETVSVTSTIQLGDSLKVDTLKKGTSLLNFSVDSMARDTTSLVKQEFQPKPRVAGLWSALLPGAGQVYNRQYWKPVLVAAGGITIGYYIKAFSRSKEFYRQVLILHDVDSSATYIETYVDAYPNLDKITNAEGKHIALFSEEQIELEYNNKRQTLQNLYIFGVVLYGLNILDAVVSAHLKNFDVSDDLTLNIQPNVINANNTLDGLGAGVSFKFSLK